MDEDLLAKILLSILLVGYYEKIDVYEDILNKKVHKDKNELDCLEDIAAADENYSNEGQYEKVRNFDINYSVDNYSKNNDIDKIEELSVKDIASEKSYFVNNIKLSNEVVTTKEVNNDLYGCYEKNYNVEDFDYEKPENSITSDGFEARKISSLNVLLASIKIPVSIEKLFNLKREKIYCVENISCDIKQISGNLLLLKNLKHKSKVKLFYSGILRIRVKYLSVDHIEDRSLHCNTKDLILYESFSGTINTLIETRMIEGLSSVNIPINIDLLGSEFNAKYILEAPTTIYDIMEKYYKCINIIGEVILNISLLKEIYAAL